MIKTLAWVLPRPRRTRYKGGFPLHFEKKLLWELGIELADICCLGKIKVLHPFGGHAEYGYRVDILRETEPDIVGDAHNLMFKDNTFGVVILDPPFSDEYSQELYKTGKLNFKQYTQEAVRVTKPGGHIVMYHYLATPRLEKTILVMRIFMETRIWHKLRCVHIYKKEIK